MPSSIIGEALFHSGILNKKMDVKASEIPKIFSESGHFNGIARITGQT
jgi:hypothetical protein